MTDHKALLSRRAVLGAGVAGLAFVSGCTSHHAAPPDDPDEAALDAARQGERVLLAAYADGSPAHAIHLAHLRALGGTLPATDLARSPGPATSRGPVPPERATVQPLMAAARNARRGTTAALLASVAASHAVLGGMRVS